MCCWSCKTNCPWMTASMVCFSAFRRSLEVSAKFLTRKRLGAGSPGYNRNRRQQASKQALLVNSERPYPHRLCALSFVLYQAYSGELPIAS
jgi:hypothetical protein